MGGLGLVPAAADRRQAHPEEARLHLRLRWEDLAQLRTGSHWLAEETGRCLRPPQPGQARICPQCREGVEAAARVVYDCPLYVPQRRRWHSLFPADKPPLPLYLPMSLLSQRLSQCSPAQSNFPTLLHSELPSACLISKAASPGRRRRLPTPADWVFPA